MTDESQTKLEDVEDTPDSEEISDSEDTPDPEETSDSEDTPDSGELDDPEATREGDDAVEDPSDEEEVHDVLTADELEEKEEAAAAASDEEEVEAEEEEAAAEEGEEPEEPEAAAKEEDAEPAPIVEGTWYAIQTYSGHENKVQKLIQRRIEDEPGDTPAEKEIREVLVPTQEVVEIRNGKRVTVTKRLYPGYVLVNMDLNDRTMHTINNIQGVIKFVGGGTRPQPLRDEEIKKILGIETGAEEEKDEEEVPFHAGQVVEVTQGPFSDFSGTVQEVYADKGKAKVEVSLFGRPTSVELDFTQLKGY